MNEVSFVDTNILVYAYDSSSGIKHIIAFNLMNNLWTSRSGILSTQVLCEFFVTVTKKIQNPIPVNQAKLIIKDYISFWPIINISQDMIIEAIDATESYSLSFWDALIWSAARNFGAMRIYTEDLQHQLVIDSVQFINPFL